MQKSDFQKLLLCNIFTGLLLSLALASCHFEPHREGILIVSDGGEKGNEALFMQSVHTGDLSYLSEDSLAKFEQLMLYQLSADSLDAARQRNIERFVCQGGEVYFWQVDKRYRHMWPLLEKLKSQGDEPVTKSGNILASSSDEVKSFTYGAGNVYYLSDELSWTREELSTFLAHNRESIKFITDTSLPAYPDPQRFTYATLFSGLNEPMEIEILPDLDILLIERGGAIKYYDHELEKIKTIATISVNNSQSNGLNGLAIYPDFRRKPWVFVSYSHATEPFQYISRFYLAGDSLIMNSEKVIMRVPHHPDDANHASNALEFDAAGNLYIGFGDYTAQPEGYAPIDERPGKLRRDAQRTAGSSNNPLGGILRIHPEEDGTYSIPMGNLYPKNDTLSLAEIFVQGCRNPYRFSIDPLTQHLFFGDVGPDASVDSERGTQGYEEINFAQEAGYYGWPYFVANNIAYPDFDFASETIGDFFDPENPINDSPNNSGVRNLPPARPAILWYPRQPTTEFPGMGQGGMNIMVGPVFHSKEYPLSEEKLPDYFDGKLMFYDWVRGWVKAATLDEGQVVQVEPLIDTLHFAHPTDMRLGPEGALYVLDYGSQGYAKNLDAKVVKISYARGNRKPVAKLNASEIAGATPLEVSFSAAGSFDYDRDSLEYFWQVEGKSFKGKEISYRFEKAGEHTVRLRVRDAQGAETEESIIVSAGNAPPEIVLNTSGNRSFYWDNLAYTVEVKDKEDGSLIGGQIDEAAVKVRFSYEAVASNLKNSSNNIHDLQDGKLLVQENGCVACHSMDTRSLGPSYYEVALRYRGKGQQDMLTRKIINGGEGNWNMGRAMPAHPFIEEPEARKMVSYILSLSEKPSTEQLEISGVLRFDQSENGSGKYHLEISYEDQGGNKVGPIKKNRKYTFRPPVLSAAEADYWQGVAQRVNGIALVQEDQGYLMYKDIDLQHISRIRLRLKALVQGTLEVRLNDPQSATVGKLELEQNSEWHEVEVPLEDMSTQQDLYFVFYADHSDLPANLFMLDTFQFLRSEPKL